VSKMFFIIQIVSLGVFITTKKTKIHINGEATGALSPPQSTPKIILQYSLIAFRQERSSS
jgi:hypothetical protein